MKDRLGEFEIIEPIDVGGYTTVYRAVQHMRHGLTRPAAIKILQGWATDTDEQIETLRHEVGILADVGNAPNIVTVYDFDIDEDEGPWIAMELLGRNLRHFVAEDPTEPELVRSMLYDMGRALSVLHNSDPMIIHRDIKPNNILSTEYGIWKLSDFGIARREASEEDTVNVMSVKFASPELLDGSLGKVTHQTDLYSLGLVAYEYALGRELFRKQFPSIYDPQGDPSQTDDKSDDRPKWMYWHSSFQMTLPPLADVIEGYPQDISDTIAHLTAKPTADRLDTAEEMLSSLNMHTSGKPAFVAPVRKEESKTEEKKSSPIIGLALGLAAAVLFLLLVAVAYVSLGRTPEVILVQDANYQGNTPEIIVRGEIKHFPSGAEAYVQDTRRKYPAPVDDDGNFIAEVRVPRLEQTSAALVVERNGKTLAKKNLTVERLAPEKVQVRVRVTPVVQGVVVKMRELDNDNRESLAQTNSAGLATVTLRYGQFELSLEHPRFEPRTGVFDTGIDPVNEIEAPLRPISGQQIIAKRNALMAEMEEVAKLAAAGDPDAIARLAEIQKELLELEDNPQSAEAQARAALVAELAEVAQKAANGDAGAQRRLREINREFGELNRNSTNNVARRAAIQREMDSLRARAAAGDPVAQRRLRELERESASLDRADRRSAIQREMDSLREAAEAGDPEAQRRMRELQGELATIERADRRAAIQREMDELQAAADAGDPEAKRRLAALRSELDSIDRADRRAAIIRERDSLKALAAAGDPEAQRRLRELDRELAQLEQEDQMAPNETAARRAELVREMGALAARVAAGDPEAIKRMREIQQELTQLEQNDPSGATTAIGARRQELLSEMATLTELAAAGDPAAIQRLQEIQRELSTLGAIESAAAGSQGLASAAAQMMGGTPTLDLIDQATLLQLTPEQFRLFIEVNVPTGALQVEDIPHLSRLRIRGPLLSEREMELLESRLAPAMARLQLEIRIDPATLGRRLSRAMEYSGGREVVVHPYITDAEEAIYVKFNPTQEFDTDRARVIANRFVLDQDLLFIQPF